MTPLFRTLAVAVLLPFALTVLVGCSSYASDARVILPSFERQTLNGRPLLLSETCFNGVRCITVNFDGISCDFSQPCFAPDTIPPMATEGPDFDPNDR